MPRALGVLACSLNELRKYEKSIDILYKDDQEIAFYGDGDVNLIFKAYSAIK